VKALDEGAFLNLAEAVADGSDVDWADAESSARDPWQRRVVQQLRLLATVGNAARAAVSTWGPLEIRGEVGGGTFGTVFRGWDPRLEREVAVKLLHSSAAPTTALVEGRLLAQIRHPNVVTVYGADVFDGRTGIWMEFVTGRTLKDILAEQGPFGAHEAALIGRDLCRALAAVHQKGFLHRDVKAQNVMREEGGRIVLMDFGAGDPISAAATAALKGSPVYIAPEVLAGAPPDRRSDIYALGILLYHLVSGAFPVTGQSLDDLRANHAQRRVKLLRDVRPDLSRDFLQVVDFATAADPAARPESAGALERRLEDVLRGTTESARPRANWRVPALVAAAVLIVATLTSGFAWLLRPAPTPADAGAASSRRSSVAILPFQDLNPGGGEGDYFISGIIDDLVAHLTSLRDVRVIAGNSTRRYRNRDKTEIEIGKELGVAAVLDGSIRRNGNRVRIVPRLVDTQTGEQLWSEIFERNLDDTMTMQSEVARKIAVALKGELAEPDVALLGTVPSRDFEAYNLYLKGRYYWRQRTESGIGLAIEHYQKAIARDPVFALAYTGLADAYMAQGVYNVIPRVVAYDRAEAAAAKAIALDPNLAEAHASLAYVQKNRFNWNASQASFERAIALKPGLGHAHQWYSILLTQLGRFAEAITECKTAINLDPHSIPAVTQLASAFLMARRYDAAIEQFEAALVMDSGLAIAYRGIAMARVQQGLYEEAETSLARAARQMPAGAEDRELKSDIAYVRARAGRIQEAQRIIDELAARFTYGGERVAGTTAAIYAGMGRVEAAFDWLAKAVATDDPELNYIKVDPRWDPLRSDRRFDAMLKSLGLAEN
jgi:serine/threonine protein kinase/tetratricopeptide (TPR) repeat protein